MEAIILEGKSTVSIWISAPNGFAYSCQCSGRTYWLFWMKASRCAWKSISIVLTYVCVIPAGCSWMICEGGGSRLFRNVGSHVKDHHTSNAGGHNINLIMCRLVIITKSLRWTKCCNRRTRSKRSDSGRNANIFGGYSIGRCKNKSLFGNVLNSQWLPI